MKMGVQKTVEVEAKTLSLHMKVCDQFEGRLQDQGGAQIGNDYEGYVPSFFPGDHYGDYLILDIDIETGQITNWKKPTADELKETFCKSEED
jgi:hypothetical protein